MERLTYRTDNGEYTGMPNSVEIRTALEKLSKIEDMEEELGIDLTMLFKALKNGIYGKAGSKIEHILAPRFSFYRKKIYVYKIKDYGKTWALTKEELE